MKWLAKIATVPELALCSMSVVVSNIAPMCCRGHWYQPEEPENLNDFLRR